MRIAVVGAGIAGSYLAYLLLDNVDVTVFEMGERYDYPCGEAVPSSALFAWPLPRYVVHEVRRLIIRVYDGCATHSRDIDFGRTVGYVIDKEKFVDDMRLVLERRGILRISTVRRIDLLKGFDLVVDARGPFSDSKEYDKLAVVQGFTNDVEIERDTIYMYFNSNILGYFWIFPSSDPEYKSNIGFGATGVKNVAQLFKAIARRHGIENIANTRGKKIKVADPGKVAVDSSNRIARIGEAGGFVVPFTGEGIRPALESARELYDIISNEDRVPEILKAFRRSGVVKRYSRHHRLYKLLKILGSGRAAKLLLRLEEGEFERLLSGGIGIPTLLKHALFPT